MKICNNMIEKAKSCDGLEELLFGKKEEKKSMKLLMIIFFFSMTYCISAFFELLIIGIGKISYWGISGSGIKFEDSPWDRVVNLIAGIGCIVAVIYQLKLDKRSFESAGLIKKNAFFEYITGLVIGTVLLTLSVLVIMLLGDVDIQISFASANKVILVCTFIGYIFQGFSEEFLYRGSLMIKTATEFSISTAVLLSSVLFSFAHLFNKGINFIAIINLFFFGVVFAIYMLKRGNIWGAAAMHTSWNFVQGNVFGIKVSGNDVTDTVLTTDCSRTVKLLSGGDFGIEGGLGVTIVLVIALIIVYFIPKSKLYD